MRLAMAIALALTVAGCRGMARQLEIGEPTDTADGGGLLVLVLDANVETMDFCGPGYALPCFRAGPFRGRDSIRVLAVPAGTVCVTRMVIDPTAASAEIYEPDAPGPCTTIHAGAVTYPGELVVRVEPGMTLASIGRFGVRADEPHVRELLLRDFPALESAELTNEPWRPNAQ